MFDSKCGKLKFQRIIQPKISKDHSTDSVLLLPSFDLVIQNIGDFEIAGLLCIQKKFVDTLSLGLSFQICIWSQQMAKICL